MNLGYSEYPTFVCVYSTEVFVWAFGFAVQILVERIWQAEDLGERGEFCMGGKKGGRGGSTREKRCRLSHFRPHTTPTHATFPVL